MKKTILMLAITLTSYTTYAQTNTFPSSGNVGIGTTSPQTSLHVFANTSPVMAIQDNSSLLRLIPSNGINYIESGTSFSSSSADIRFTPMNATSNWMTIQGTTGNIGIGTTSPSVQFDVENQNASSIAIANFMAPNLSVNDFSEIRVGQSSSNGNSAELRFTYTGNNNSSNRLDIGSYGGASVLSVLNSGNVAIGTTDPHGYKLAINGSAIASSVTVKLYANWPDYVFKKDYKLPSLTEVKTYIDKNQHLPEIPSEQEVAKNGINLGEMNKLLTKKVEELTLYLISQNKQLSDQQKINASLQSQIDALAKKINK